MKYLVSCLFLIASCASPPEDGPEEVPVDDGVLEEPADEAADSEPSPDDEGKADGVALAGGCAAQPKTMKWQTPWDSTNTYFASGGVSQAGPFHYGEAGTHHVGCTGTYPQHYAIDWFMSFGSNVYSTIPGKVIWAGDSPNPVNSLGRYVAVEHWHGGNRYVAIHAHLSQIFVSRGQVIKDSWNLDDPNSLPNVVIGRAGRTDVSASAVTHLHHSVLMNPSFTAAGEPWGGRSVKPTRVRCFGCNNGAGGYYSKFVRAGRYRY